MTEIVRLTALGSQTWRLALREHGSKKFPSLLKDVNLKIIQLGS